jgi:membrane associated rhomboid family serine protease
MMTMQSIPLTPSVKKLLILNLVIWLLGQVILEGYFLQTPWISTTLSLVPERILFAGSVWQLLSYMFLHTSQITHILFNMLTLWFFGGELEQKWGSRFFLLYYLGCGFGAGLIYVFGSALSTLVFNLSVLNLTIPVQGASGAIFGLLLAYGMIFGDRIVHFFMIL